MAFYWEISTLPERLVHICTGLFLLLNPLNVVRIPDKSLWCHIEVLDCRLYTLTLINKEYIDETNYNN